MLLFQKKKGLRLETNDLSIKDCLITIGTAMGPSSTQNTV